MKTIRWIAFLLCLSILLSLLPVTALAQQEGEQEQTETKAATRATITENYLDIPIEVYDFRADGFLFESMDTIPCALLPVQGQPYLYLDRRQGIFQTRYF